MNCGGFTPINESNEKVQLVLDSIKTTFETETGTTYDIFSVHSYKTQVVSGTNYLIKVHLGSDTYAHLKIYQSLPYKNKIPVISSYKLNQNKDDDIC